MRYSMLVYVTKMGRTLLEATQYLRTAPEGELRTEMLENGRQMLAQIQEVLEAHSGDLRSEAPLTQLAEINVLWDGCGEGLEDRLEQFAQELPSQVNYHVRVVFFAELGEKWDAMESVYEYMRDDPRFDPVVVRTPVGRVVSRNGKQEQEIIYKDFLTPMGIPSLGYDQYDIESDCPELAFISQPYESCTLKQFWPESISKHTRLVYLPYFLPDIANERSPTTLAQLPVYRFSWKVVCPTEKQLVFYRRHAANRGANALLTGAPKTDAFALLKNRQPTWPEDWKRLEGKTIFLWNSWYDAGMSSLRFFDKLLEWFEAHEDCGLIWRAHPMTDTVVKLYHPDQYASYQKKIQRAAAAPNVVLDRETSCAAAFSASHAMVSDYSSLLPQYLLIDKPALWIESSAFRFTGEEFIESRWMERAKNVDEVFTFMERVKNGEDRNAVLRNAIRQRDLSLADGHCGKRVCELVWQELHREDLSEAINI